ncbi:hypothetical protein WL29_22385 [Burkholderia ubonensis]|uniref:Uncharacterized protein n=1 Tax=Burkholderia ubonensis TaxID=101571 RepID=A0A106QCT6_9BURK|nr:hypothetical protein [Burkholderia ubonensis]KWA84116.1 hypothetical protein WL29_22385 [Burkholderia ubonensis]
MTINQPTPLNDILRDPGHPAHADAKALTEKVESGDISLCACLGPVYDEPYCPCEMRRRGLPRSAHHKRAVEAATVQLQSFLQTGTLQRRGIYIASRASLPARAAQWRLLRDIQGWHIVSSWIDEAGEGESAAFSDLWLRIVDEIRGAERLILYVEPDDFPLKGALVEVGIALAAGVKVFVVAPGVVIESRSRRPLGSWIDHPLVKLVPNMAVALQGAARREPESTDEGA